ncbi:MAG TPA: HU family DNA-binding protein [Gemmataceae bacterium]|jgi:nucleoid DNA-binding protein|nr:HU family DNA-binding protein [Gemmataceae bacterium]
MRNRQWLALGGLLAVLAAVVGLSRAAPPPKGAEETFPQRLAKAAKLSEENASKFYQALGPTVRDDLAHGKQVSIPGLGTFRIVQVQAHRDMAAGGRPVTIPAANTVEFVPEGTLLDAASSDGAVPAETVPPFEYHPLPGQTPGQKVGPVRTPGIRTP